MTEVWEIVEEATTECGGLDPQRIPSYAFNYLQATYRANRLNLKIEGYVGAIPLADGGVIRVRSKYGDRTYLQMLFSARDLLDALDSKQLDEAAFSIGSDLSPAELLARSFANRLSRIQASGVLVNRERRTVTGAFSHGRINPRATALLLARNALNPVVSERQFATKLIAEHRVLSRATGAALAYLRADACGVQVAACKRWLREFPQTGDAADIEIVEKGLDRGDYTRSRGYYSAALSSALVLLGISGVSDKGVEVAQDCVLVHTPTLFEEYVRNTLRHIMAPLGFIVTKGAQPASEFLYKSGHYELIPDLCVYRNGELRNIGDAKYKTPDAKDHYQILAYMRQHGVKVGFFISPTQSHKASVNRFTTADGYTVHDIQIDVGDRASTEAVMSQVPSLPA